MSNSSTSILLVSQATQYLVPDNIDVAAEIFRFATLPHAFKAQAYIRADLIIVEEALLEPDPVTAITEFKRQNPRVPVLVIMDDRNAEKEQTLFAAGADDFLFNNRAVHETELQVKGLLRQSKQVRSLVVLNENLQAMMSLTRLLNPVVDAPALLAKSAHLIRTTFRLYGACVAVNEGDGCRLYVSSETHTVTKKIFETVIRNSPEDPFCWSIHNASIQIYDAVNNHDRLRQIPVLPEATRAAFLPLMEDGTALGSLGIFLRSGQSISYEDCFVYEQLAQQLSATLTQVRELESQSTRFRSSQLLLKARESFAVKTTVEDVLAELCQLIESLPEVRRVVVYRPGNSQISASEAWVDNHDGVNVAALRAAIANNNLNEHIALLAATPQILIQESDGAEDHLFRCLLPALDAQTMLALPVSASGPANGVAFIGAVDHPGFSRETLDLLRMVCLIAGQMIERLALSNRVQQTNSRFEAVLRSVSEGIFFTDEEDRVVYITPQFTELTSISASRVLDQSVDVLLQELAALTPNAAVTYGQLTLAFQNVSNLEDAPDAYPIVQLPLYEGKRELTIEFVRLPEVERSALGWCGIVQSVAESRQPVHVVDSIIELVNDNFQVPYARVRGLFNFWNEQRRPQSIHTQQTVLTELTTNVEAIGNLWDDFMTAYWATTNRLALSGSVMDVESVLDSALPRHRLDAPDLGLDLMIEPDLPQIHCDPYMLRRALQTIINRALRVTPRRSTASIAVTVSGSMLHIVVDDKGDVLPHAQLDQLFELTSRSFTGDSETLALFLARELVRRHNGDVWAEPGKEIGTSVTIALPVVARPVRMERPETVAIGDETASRTSATTTQLPGAPVRYPRTVMVLRGRSQLVTVLESVLQAAMYEILAFDTLEEAIQNLTATRFGLIVIDVTTDGGTGLKACDRIRARTPVPILLIADAVTDAEKVTGLKYGADDLITKPIGEAELAARVEVIIKRKDIADRSREPIVVGELHVDVARRQVSVGNRRLELTRIEYDLLHALITNSGRILTHRELLETVWGPEYADDTQYLWVNISRLRKKIEQRADSPRYIHTQPGVGYYFDDHGPSEPVNEVSPS